MDFLIPFFSAAYSISIRKPLLKAPIWKKRGNLSGQFVLEGRNGLIELNNAYCNAEKGYGGVVAHELGHAAEYQHHAAYFNSSADKARDYIYDALGEGIAMEFEKTGLEGLLEAEIITKNGFGTEIRSYKKTLSYNSLFIMGHKLFRFMQKRASMKEIICSPEKHFNAVMSRYGKEIASMANKSK